MLGTVKSALLGSKLRVLGVLVLTFGLVVGGGLSLGLLGAPSVGSVHNSFGDVTDETTEIRTELVVRNPNPVGVNLGGVSVDYDVTMNDVAMANGTKEGVSVGTGNSTVEFGTRMDNDKIPAWWVSHVRNDEETDLRVDATVQSSTLGRSVEAPPVEREISTDVISQFNTTEPRPIEADQPLVSDPVGYVNETGARWGEVTSSETPIDMRFTVYNAKALPMAVTEIGYAITMNDVAVGNGSSETGYVIEGRSTETIETTTAIRNGKLDEWWVSHLENDQVTELRIDFYAELELGGETVRVPLDELTYRKTIETDLFGSKADSGGAASGDETTADGGSNSDSAATTDAATADGTTTVGETTAADGTTTETETTASEGATTADETTTDDGTSGETTTTDDGLLALTNGGT